MPFASLNPTNPRTNPCNFHKKYWELPILKNSVFLSRPFWIFFASSHENQSKLLGYQGRVDILMIALVYSKRVSVRNNLLYSVNVFLLMMISIYYARKMYQYKQIHRNCVFSKFKILHSFFTASCFANLKHR